MGVFSEWMAGAKKRMGQYRNAAFRDGVMSVCALVASADGSVDASEKAKVAKLIEKNELLSIFEPGELRASFLGFCDKASDEFTRLDLFDAVRKLKGDPGQAETAVKIGLIIANADGVFDESEQKVVREIVSTLGLKADAFGLQAA